MEIQENIAHQIDQIREELFNLSFEDSGKELIHRFKLNFQRLREFMQTVDKEIASFSVFN